MQHICRIFSKIFRKTARKKIHFLIWVVVNQACSLGENSSKVSFLYVTEIFLNSKTGFHQENVKGERLCREACIWRGEGQHVRFLSRWEGSRRESGERGSERVFFLLDLFLYYVTDIRN